MPIHARPHLTTHNRNAGHSSVAAAAYRMGLKLFDRRKEIWHDYRQRARGEEVVVAKTVAPTWAPAWVHDPEELWNRVEASEQRKDSQVARDYVVPIPLGLGDRQAEELAERLARYISDQLSTPVSIGVHRDAAVDALGNIKAADQQGFHAHLLFPTRKLLPARGDDEKDDDEIQDVAAIHGFGSKLSALSNRRTSAGIVEMMNAQWAALANEISAKQGLLADYDHRSYARLGIDRVPQHHMGAPATAMERKGFFTRRGDAVREIVVMSEVYRLAHQASLDTQHAQAVIDVAQQTAAADLQPVSDDQSHSLLAVGKPENKGSNAAPEETKSDEAIAAVLRAARDRGMQADASLVDSFVAASPVPDDDPGHRVLFELTGLVKLIQQSLRLLASLTERLREHRENFRRFKSSELDVQFQLDEARKHRQAAKATADAWASAHHWRVLSAKVLSSGDTIPSKLSELRHEADIQDRFVQDLKATQRSMRDERKVLSDEKEVLHEQEEQLRKRLVTSVEAFVYLDERSAPVLMGLLSPEDRVAFQEALPTPTAVKPRDAALPSGESSLALRPPQPRPSTRIVPR